jgi:hypothetical protein
MPKNDFDPDEIARNISNHPVIENRPASRINKRSKRIYLAISNPIHEALEDKLLNSTFRDMSSLINHILYETLVIPKQKEEARLASKPSRARITDFTPEEQEVKKLSLQNRLAKQKATVENLARKEREAILRKWLRTVCSWYTDEHNIAHMTMHDDTIIAYWDRIEALALLAFAYTTYMQPENYISNHSWTWSLYEHKSPIYKEFCDDPTIMEYDDGVRAIMWENITGEAITDVELEKRLRAL